MQSSHQDVIDTAIAAGNFNTLTSALRSTDLAGKLKATGPFTVFAPTDEAFRKLPAGTLENLMKDKAKLASVLSHHVVPGKILAKDIKSGDSKTVQGDTLKIMASPQGVTVDGAKVTKADIESSNGVIHGIDTVIMPK